MRWFCCVYLCLCVHARSNATHGADGVDPTRFERWLRAKFSLVLDHERIVRPWETDKPDVYRHYRQYVNSTGAVFVRLVLEKKSDKKTTAASGQRRRTPSSRSPASRSFVSLASPSRAPARSDRPQAAHLVGVSICAVLLCKCASVRYAAAQVLGAALMWSAL